MKKEEIHLGDFRRWLIGNTTPEFMLEVFIRTTLIYLVLLFVVRLMGKRMTSQLTITELAVMISLGAIVSPSMQLPGRGLMFAVAGLLIAVIFQRGLNLWAFKNEKIEHLTQGKMITLVKDGRLMLHEIEKSNITRQQVFAKLRENDVHNLGSVKRVYLEACGTLSVYKEESPQPGLPVMPSKDSILMATQEEAADSLMACSSCGHVQYVHDDNSPCENCHENKWIKAYAVK